MIEKNEVITMANGLSLSPDTVEKDYVLSWLLWGINNHSSFINEWLFKGGTCLKKCYFETFRFSEDLDFTLSNPTHLSAEFLRVEFDEITDKIHDETGIEFFKDQFRFKIMPKDNGKVSAQGVIQYNGPLRRRQGNTRNFASIKLDLTDNEIVVLQPQKRKVHHPYSDEPSASILANCYAFEEVVAEKIRALAERARPRDLYDVVHFFRNRGMIKNIQLVYNVLTKKCSYKKIPIPTYLSIKNHEKLDELDSQWHNMLAHQLPALPPLESFWVDLEPFFEWINGGLKEQQLVSQTEEDGKIFRPGRISGAYSLDAVVQKIQFAAANRVCVEIEYNGKIRIIEPLSFRQARSGNKLFFGYERGAENHPKSFTLSKIQSASITNMPYTEKQYAIEINASGYVVMPPIRRGVGA